MTCIAAAGVVAAMFAVVGVRFAEAQPPELRVVEGRVVRPVPAAAGDSTIPGDSMTLTGIPSRWVTLHRVAPDLAGPLDSMRTDAAGRYRFRYTPSGGPEAIYFVSASHDGIAYFTNPLRGLEVRGAEAEIVVFDTTSRVFPLTVRGRHLIVGALDSARQRTVVEIFELSNDSLRTLVSPDGDDANPTWTLALPLTAREVKTGQGDLPTDAFVQARGRVSLYAALAPGLKQFSLSYLIDEGDFPLTLPIDGGAVVLEVLLEEPDARVTGAALVATEPLTLEGRRFQRYLAQDVRAGDTIVVHAPGGVGGRRLYVTVLLGAIGFLMLLALLRAGIRRQRAPGFTAPRMPVVSEVPTPDRLAREIADLDAAYAAQAEPSEAVRTAYERRRAELADALREALAAGGRKR